MVILYGLVCLMIIYVGFLNFFMYLSVVFVLVMLLNDSFLFWSWVVVVIDVFWILFLI